MGRILVLFTLVFLSWICVAEAKIHRVAFEKPAHVIESSGWDLEISPNPRYRTFIDTDGNGRAEVWCWSRAEWALKGYTGVHLGLYNGLINLPAPLCERLSRSLAGWEPSSFMGRFYLGVAAFTLSHEAAHSAGQGHDERNCRSADGIAARHIRLTLMSLGQPRGQRFAIENVLRRSSVGYYPARTARCWQS